MATLRLLLEELQFSEEDAQGLLSQDVHLDDLRSLTLDELKEVVPKLGPRKRLQKWIQKQADSETYSAYIELEDEDVASQSEEESSSAVLTEVSEYTSATRVTAEPTKTHQEKSDGDAYDIPSGDEDREDPQEERKDEDDVQQNAISIFDEITFESDSYNMRPSKFIYIAKEDLSSITLIGEGNFGLAFKATYNQQTIVVKAPKLKPGKDEMIELQISLQIPAHPNVLSAVAQCHNFLYHPHVTTARPAIASPFQLHGDLRTFFKKKETYSFSDQDYVNLAIGMAKGVHHLHQNQIIHRDIALRNFLLSADGRVKITDFGLSRIMEQKEEEEMYYRMESEGAVPWRWCAPESLVDKKFNTMTDVWMLGVAVWELFHASDMPFSVCKNPMKFVIDESIKLELSDKIPKVMQNVITECGNRDPALRPTTNKILAMLEEFGSIEPEKRDKSDARLVVDKDSVVDIRLKRALDVKDSLQDQLSRLLAAEKAEDRCRDITNSLEPKTDELCGFEMKPKTEPERYALAHSLVEEKKLDYLQEETKLTLHKLFGSSERTIWCKSGRLFYSKAKENEPKSISLVDVTSVKYSKRKGDKSFILSTTKSKYEFEAATTGIRNTLLNGFERIIDEIQDGRINPWTDEKYLNKKPVYTTQSKEIDKQVVKDWNADSLLMKLLLVGPGNSGKQQLFRQIFTLYGKGYSHEELRSYRSIIHTSVIGALQTLVEKSDHFAGMYGVEQFKVLFSNRKSKETLQSCSPDDEISEDLGKHIQTLWADPGIQWTFARRGEFQLQENVEYFLENIERISQADYLPDDNDILRMQNTTGVKETLYQIDGITFVLIDVGGQRNERNKWIHQFEEVTAVLFVASISCYDQVLFEDESTNELHEAINLFEELANNTHFEETGFILILNKKDLFEEKLKRVPLTTAFPEYDGDPHDYEQCVEYVSRQFLEKTKRDVHQFVTSSTDTRNVEYLFQATKDIVIKQGLARAGL